jgi:predicted O-linked N-acetylglucosamine transferase (SPINDLY family)
VTDAAALLQHADALHAARRLDEAAAVYRQALALDETLVEAWYGLGCCHLARHSYGAAAEALERAVTLRPDAAGARSNLAEALFQLGRVDDAVQHYISAADNGHPEVARISLEALACIAPGALSLDNTAVLAVRQHWANKAVRNIVPLTPAPRDAARRLRIGYVSAFFGARNWMKPVFGVINHHDRSRFEIHMLSDGDDPSEAAGYVDHPEDRIWQTNPLSNELLAKRVAEAGIDVLVDLNCYTVQRRLSLFMHRPARCQITWFNAYATTGLSCFDYAVADAATLPPDEEVYCSERIHRVSGSYLAFNVRYPVPDVAPPPCLRNGQITFGCLGSSYKLTDTTIEAWSRILRAVPDTRLLLKNSRLDDASNRRALLARFSAHGIAEHRLQLEGAEEHFDFLRAYDRIDIALDTFPYNGGTTTTEALWQGVPVLTFNGDRWASRTSRSLLLAAGLPDWVADNARDFIDAAIRLALTRDTPQRLAVLRASMREQLRASAACGCSTLCRELEALYLELAA